MPSFKHKTNVGPGYHTQVFVLARQTYHQLTCLRVCVAQAALDPPAQPQELSVDVTTPLAVLADLVLFEIGLVWFEHIHCSLQSVPCSGKLSVPGRLGSSSPVSHCDGLDMLLAAEARLLTRVCSEPTV